MQPKRLFRGPPPDRERLFLSNDQIRAHTVRCIAADGQQIGVIQTHIARAKASAAGLDLVQIPGEADPPICKIVSADAFRFQMQKAEREQRQRGRSDNLKEVQLTPSTEANDLQRIAGRVTAFVSDGCRVQVQVRFKGREMAHRELGRQALHALLAACGASVRLEHEPTQDGKRLIAMVVGSHGAKASESATTAVTPSR